MSEERLLAIIPARSGSKRLPNKNIRMLGDRPLIAWSIASGLDAGLFCDVLVSTDDQKIADIASVAGALVPWLRPAELATDTANTGNVLQHALAWYEASNGSVGGVVLLQPTSPFRNVASIQGAAIQFLQQPTADRKPIVSVSPTAEPPEWCFRIVDGLLDPILGWGPIGCRSQDLPPAYKLNGSIYIEPAATVRVGGPLIVPGAMAFQMNSAEEALDIDTEFDWLIAESFLASKLTAL